MKLYIWRNVLCDHSCGMIICIADDVESARIAYRKQWEKDYKMEIFGSYLSDVYDNDPIVYDLSISCEAICHYVTGGD